MRLCNSTNIFNFNLKIPYTVSPENAIAALAAAGYKHIDMNLCGLSRIGKPSNRIGRLTEIGNWFEKYLK